MKAPGAVVFALKDRTFSGVVATFSPGGKGLLGDDYPYAIDWGDGPIDTGITDGNTS